MKKIGEKVFGELGGKLNIIILHFDILHVISEMQNYNTQLPPNLLTKLSPFTQGEIDAPVGRDTN